MIKQHAIMPKKPGWTDEEFSKYLRVRHGGFGLQVDQYPHCYVQLHRMAMEFPGLPSAPENYRGVSQGWFKEFADVQSLMNNKTFLEGAAADMHNFSEFGAPLFVSEEQPVKVWSRFTTDRPSLEAILFINWRQPLQPEATPARLTMLTEQAAQLPQVIHGAACTPLLVKDGGPEEQPFAGVIELWWQQVEHFEEMAKSSEVTAFAATLEAVIDTERSYAMVGENFRMRWR